MVESLKIVPLASVPEAPKPTLSPMPAYACNLANDPKRPRLTHRPVPTYNLSHIGTI